MPISFRSKLSSTVANNTFLDKTVDDLKKGKLGLYKVDVSEGSAITDVQQYISEIVDTVGITGEGDATSKTYSSEQIIANGDDRKVAIGKLDAQVKTNLDDIALLDGRVTQNELDIQAIEDDYGQPDGLATLDSSGLVPLSQLPNTLLKYQGTWDASANTPTLTDGTGDANSWYRVNVAGSVDFGSGTIAFLVGDKVVYNGTTWEKWDTTDEVTSVNGQGGDVVLDNSDIGLANVTNDAQLKRAASDFASFPEKAIPVNDDIVLIEDSEDSFSKKKLKLANMIGGGEGGGGLDVFYTQGMDTLDDVSGFATGNNASFLGGGTIQGTLALEEVAPLSGTKSLKYTQAPGSLNDYFASEVIDLDLKQRDNTNGMTFYFEYDGADNDGRFVVYDVTNGQEIASEVNFVKLASKATRYSLSFYVPASCTQIRWGYQVLVENVGAVLLVDDVEMSSDPFVEAKIQDEAFGRFDTQAGYGSVATKIPYYTHQREYNGNGIVKVENSSINGWSLTALRRTKVSINAHLPTDGSSVVGISINAPSLTQNLENLGTEHYTGALYIPTNLSTAMVSLDIILNPGDTLRPHTIGNTITGTNRGAISFTATATTDAILTPSDTFSTDTAPLTFSTSYNLTTLADAPIGTYLTFAYAANTNTRVQTIVPANRPTQTDADMNQNGIRIFTRAFNAGSSSVEPAAFAIQIGKGLKGHQLNLYKNVGKITSGQLDVFYDGNSNKFGLPFKEYNESTGVMYLDAGFNQFGTSGASFIYNDLTSQTSGYLTINAGKTLPLLAIPTPLVAYLKDTKPSGVNGGTFTSGAWQTRTLNTVEGDGSFVSLSGNQFTLGPGKYEIEASAPAYKVNGHQARLYNNTDSIEEKEGTTSIAEVVGAEITRSLVHHVLNLKSAKSFTIEHRCSVTRATDGYGSGVNYGAEIVFTVCKITKLS